MNLYSKYYNLQKMLSFRRCFVDNEEKADSVDPFGHLHINKLLFRSSADNSELYPYT